jgi:hypothetical protein
MGFRDIFESITGTNGHGTALGDANIRIQTYGLTADADANVGT